MKELSQKANTKLREIGKDIIEAITQSFENDNGYNGYTPTLNINREPLELELRETLLSIRESTYKKTEKDHPNLLKSKGVQDSFFYEEKISKTGRIRALYTLASVSSLGLVSDIEKVLLAAYVQNAIALNTKKKVEKFLNEKLKESIQKASIVTTINNAALKTVNDARNEFIDDYENEIESITYDNPDPQSAICQYLKGKTVKPNSSDAAMYQPPLHFGNCKTYMIINEKSFKDNPSLTGKLKPNKEEIKSANLK